MSKTILIVDDNKKLRKITQEWLGSVFPDCTITSVVSGSDAIQYFSKEKPDIVIMDIRRAGIDRIDVTRYLKNKYPLAKIIFLTIYDDVVHRDSAFCAGASGYIVKSKINTDLIPLLKKLMNSEVGESAPAIP